MKWIYFWGQILYRNVDPPIKNGVFDGIAAAADFADDISGRVDNARQKCVRNITQMFLTNFDQFRISAICGAKLKSCRIWTKLDQLFGEKKKYKFIKIITVTVIILILFIMTGILNRRRKVQRSYVVGRPTPT